MISFHAFDPFKLFFKNFTKMFFGIVYCLLVDHFFNQMPISELLFEHLHSEVPNLIKTEVRLHMMNLTADAYFIHIGISLLG